MAVVVASEVASEEEASVVEDFEEASLAPVDPEAAETSTEISTLIIPGLTRQLIPLVPASTPEALLVRSMIFLTLNPASRLWFEMYVYPVFQARVIVF